MFCIMFFIANIITSDSSNNCSINTLKRKFNRRYYDFILQLFNPARLHLNDTFNCLEKIVVTSKYIVCNHTFLLNIGFVTQNNCTFILILAIQPLCTFIQL